MSDRSNSASLKFVKGIEVGTSQGINQLSEGARVCQRNQTADELVWREVFVHDETIRGPVRRWCRRGRWGRRRLRLGRRSASAAVGLPSPGCSRRSCTIWPQPVASCCRRSGTAGRGYRTTQPARPSAKGARTTLAPRLLDGDPPYRGTPVKSRPSRYDWATRLISDGRYPLETS